jgi:hypothetical protein
VRTRVQQEIAIEHARRDVPSEAPIHWIDLTGGHAACPRQPASEAEAVLGLSRSEGPSDAVNTWLAFERRTDLGRSAFGSVGRVRRMLTVGLSAAALGVMSQ